jgi:hypothetical protein
LPSDPTRLRDTPDSRFVSSVTETRPVLRCVFIVVGCPIRYRPIWPIYCQHIGAAATALRQEPQERRASTAAQIQLWKIISRLKVAIDVPTNAAEIGSIAAKPADAIATKAHNSQPGLLPRLNAWTSARLATVADGR